MDAILDELAETVLVHINAARLAVMDVALDHRRIGARLHLEAGYPIVVDVVLLEVALQRQTAKSTAHGQSQSTRRIRDHPVLTMPLSNVKMPTSRP